MKKILVFLLMAPLFALGQKQNVVNASRYFPKTDKVQEFEKAFTAHIQKYHSGEWKWRVYEIMSGPDAGGYQVTEGPKTWDEFDKRGNLGADHMNDWNKNVAIYLTDKYSSLYGEYQEDLSSVGISDFSDKITITHVYPKPAMGAIVQETIRKAAKAWKSGNQSVAVYQSVASGPGQYALVFRLKGGLKDLGDDSGTPFKARYETANGEGTFDTFLDKIKESTDHSWSEMLFFRADLSAK